MHHGTPDRGTDEENMLWMAAPPGFEPGLLVPKANRISTTPRGRDPPQRGGMIKMLGTQDIMSLRCPWATESLISIASLAPVLRPG